MTLTELSDGYLATIVRRYGVPEMWVQDAIQDIRIYYWQHPNAPKYIAGYRAIDAVRRYGVFGRYGVLRSPSMSIDDLLQAEDGELNNQPQDQHDLLELVEKFMVYEAAWRKLACKDQKHVLYATVAGRAVGISQSRLSQIRKKLREML